MTQDRQPPEEPSEPDNSVVVTWMPMVLETIRVFGEYGNSPSASMLALGLLMVGTQVIAALRKHA